MQIYSFSPFGYEGNLVTVEVDLRRGIPAIDVVGLADNAVRESRERMRSAIINSGFDFPMERVLISLSPADLKKEGAGFDLPLAAATLLAQKEFNERNQADLKFRADDGGGILIMGELELSGSVRPVRGIHAAAATAAQSGITKCIVPQANGDEAREVKGMSVCAVNSLSEAWAALSHPENFSETSPAEEAFIPENSVSINGVLFPAESADNQFSSIRGQKNLVRALEIAAAGGHNLLAYGPPGCGKTLALQRFPELLPLLTVEEAQSVTRIHSLAGMLKPNEPLIRTAPFRMPHQTASIEGICGGGINCRPGEISLAHNGVLFLDEAAEFKSSVLQMLRVPVENKMITLCRAGRSTVYPAGFQLLMATNPCPCGNYGSSSKICLCSAKSVDMYWRKFSGPLLDRIDIRIKVENPGENDTDYSVPTHVLRESVARAVKIQRKRQGKKNANLTPQEILDFCILDESERKFMEEIEISNDFSKRALSSILKLSRTLADMEEKENIGVSHLKEAISLRSDSGPLSLFAGDF